MLNPFSIMELFVDAVFRINLLQESVVHPKAMGMSNCCQWQTCWVSEIKCPATHLFQPISLMQLPRWRSSLLKSPVLRQQGEGNAWQDLFSQSGLSAFGWCCLWMYPTTQLSFNFKWNIMITLITHNDHKQQTCVRDASLLIETALMEAVLWLPDHIAGFKWIHYDLSIIFKLF